MSNFEELINIILHKMKKTTEQNRIEQNNIAKIANELINYAKDMCSFSKRGEWVLKCRMPVGVKAT